MKSNERLYYFDIRNFHWIKNKNKLRNEKTNKQTNIGKRKTINWKQFHNLWGRIKDKQCLKVESVENGSITITITITIQISSIINCYNVYILAVW